MELGRRSGGALVIVDTLKISTSQLQFLLLCRPFDFKKDKREKIVIHRKRNQMVRLSLLSQSPT